GDETGLRSDDVRGRSSAPAGKTPQIRVMNRREGLMSTVTHRGKVRWMVFEGAMNPDILIDFMKRHIKEAAAKKVLLILDHLKVHHAKVVKAWLAANAHEIEVFYLPPYGPQLDANLKAVVSSKAPARAKGDLKKATISHLRKLQKSPKRLMRYFQYDPVQYAA
ncbi:MAG TPA: transposase, partial [Candidatus Acidoferrales bacterium]|nr:transposase [Candidatus Acidoferrales bacterium]